MELDDPEAPAQEAAPEAAAGGGLEARAAAQYTGPETRCAMCTRFDGEGQCSLGWPAEPEGHCMRFEGAGGESEEMSEDAMPGPESADADIEALEELG